MSNSAHTTANAHVRDAELVCGVVQPNLSVHTHGRRALIQDRVQWPMNRRAHVSAHSCSRCRETCGAWPTGGRKAAPCQCVAAPRARAQLPIASCHSSHAIRRGIPLRQSPNELRTNTTKQVKLRQKIVPTNTGMTPLLHQRTLQSSHRCFIRHILNVGIRQLKC